jgi:long-chain fatty acid transport protein
LLLGYLWSEPVLDEDSSTDPGFAARQVVPYRLETPVIGLGFNLDRTFKGKLPVHMRLGVMNLFPDNFKTIYRVWDPHPATPRWIRYGDYWDRVHLLGALSIQAAKIPWVSLGVGFRWIVSGENTVVPRAGTPGLELILIDLFGTAKAAGNIDVKVDSEAALTAGVMITPNERLRLGYSFRDSLSLVLGPILAIGKVQVGEEGGITLAVNLLLNYETYYSPQQHNFGASYRWDDRWLLSLDLSWLCWSGFTSESREGQPEPSWDDTLVPRMGIEYRPIQALALRFGYFYEPSPVPEQKKTSNYLDNDRHAFSWGIGYTFSDPFHIVRQPMDIDLAFQYVYMPARETEKDPAFAPPVEYETRGEIFSIGGNITFHF